MGQAFKHLFSFRGIEKKHIALHQTYQEIFEMMAAQANKPVSFMGRLFETSSRNVGMSDEYKHLLKEKAKELEQLSYSVIKNLNELESIILIMSDEQIATTIGTISSLNAESTKNNGALHNKKVIIPGELHKQLKGLLHQYIGPITNIFYEQTKQKYLKDNTNEDLDDFIVQLIVEIPEAKQSEFQRQVQEILRKYKVNF
ncbi:hypothetical protein TI04_08100 [Achromatium sp. WMS2]|nr:hypothetical protein TI04_08100 [Achromatium sp. WMS2]